MLTFESPFYEIEDVIVFRDHASPITFHYLAGPPRLTRSPDENPNLLLLKYKKALDAMTTGAAPTRDQLGGAFLLFGVDCGLSESTKNAIKNKLQAFVPPDAGDITLVPVLYTKGTVSVVALDQQQAAAASEQDEKRDEGKFVRGILGSSTPSLLQDQRAIFSISLTPDAATLIEEAYESDLSPIGVMYELQFAGLRPALSVKAEVDMKRVYQSLKMGLHLGVRSGESTTTSTSTTAAPTSGTTTTTTTRPPASTASTTTTPAPTTTTSTTTRPPTTTATTPAPATTTTRPPTTTTTRAPATPTGAPQTTTGVYLSADLSFTMEKLRQEQAIKIEIVRQQEGQSVDQMERNAMELLKETLLNDFFKPAMSNSPATAASTAAAAASQMMATSTDTNRGKAGQNAVEIGFQLQYKREEELKTASYDYSVIAPETRTHAPNGFFSALLTRTEKVKHIREIDLDDPFFKVLEVEVTTTADFEALDLQAITVQMQYGGTIDRPRVQGDASFTPTKKELERFLASFQENEYIYRYAVAYNFGQAERVAAQSFKTQTPWRTTTQRALVVHPPEDVAMLRVYVEPGVVDWDVIRQIESRLIYEDAANNFRTERTFLISSDSKRQEWIVRLTDPKVSSYKLQNRWHLKDLSEIEGKSEEHRESHLFIADPFVDRLPISVDPHVDSANVARINVELHYEDPANNFVVRKQVELEAPFKRVTASIPIVDSTKREYSYAVSLVKPNGQAENYQPKTTDQLSIIITEGGVYLDVDVVLVGDLAALAVDALQVDLQSEPLTGAQPKVESHLFLPGEAKKFTQRLLLRADRPTQFEYRTLVISGGNEIGGDWRKHQSKILLLQVGSLLRQS